jgi:FtsP/CotA-like multicopper oxidase with cupredoxin domain
MQISSIPSEESNPWRPFRPLQDVVLQKLGRSLHERTDGSSGKPKGGSDMISRNVIHRAIVVFSAIMIVALTAGAQVGGSIYYQCPGSTLLHPGGGSEIKCLHLGAGDGVVRMADDQQKLQYIFSFSELDRPGEGGAPTDPSAYAGWVMNQGFLAANAPAPTISIDEDDEFFLNLTNVGMAIRPDLFDPHTVHFHGFPNASSVFDGVPDSSLSILMGATFTYYYHAVDAGTYMYHCHVEATEHMQMGMLGNLYVRPRQNKEVAGTNLYTAFANNAANTLNGGLTPPPAINTGAARAATGNYAYNDGDGSTYYDVDYPMQIGSFDPDFHDASYFVQPLPFAGMRDRYFLLNGRGYPDTVDPDPLSTYEPEYTLSTQTSQLVSSLIEAAPGDRILLRISNLNVTDFYTVGTSGIPMEVVGLDARLLRDGAGNNMSYTTNSITIGGGQSADVIITAPATPGTYFFYAKNLDKLANDAENFGGMMTEIRVN